MLQRSLGTNVQQPPSLAQACRRLRGWVHAAADHACGDLTCCTLVPFSNRTARFPTGSASGRVSRIGQRACVLCAREGFVPRCAVRSSRARQHYKAVGQHQCGQIRSGHQQTACSWSAEMPPVLPGGGVRTQHGALSCAASFFVSLLLCPLCIHTPQTTRSATTPSAATGAAPSWASEQYLEGPLVRGSALAQPLLGRTCASHDTWLSSAWALPMARRSHGWAFASAALAACLGGDHRAAACAGTCCADHSSPIAYADVPTCAHSSASLGGTDRQSGASPASVPQPPAAAHHRRQRRGI